MVLFHEMYSYLALARTRHLQVLRRYLIPILLDIIKVNASQLEVGRSGGSVYDSLIHHLLRDLAFLILGFRLCPYSHKKIYGWGRG